MNPPPLPRPNPIGRFFVGLWDVMNFTRRLILNLLFFGLLFLVLVVFLAALGKGGGVQPLQERTTLVIAPEGRLVEQFTADPVTRALARAFGDRSAEEVQLRDLLRAIEAAKDDKHIERVLLQLDKLEPAGMASMREVAAALSALRASGKQVVAFGGEADTEQRTAAGTLALRHGQQDVGVLGEVHDRRLTAAVLLDLLLRLARRPPIGHGGGGNEHVGRGFLRQRGLQHVAGGSDVEAAHAARRRLAHGASDERHVGAREIFPLGGAGDAAILAEQRARLLEVERLALGEVFLRGNVEEHDVAELARHREVRELAADVACADETDLFTSHGIAF